MPNTAGRLHTANSVVNGHRSIQLPPARRAPDFLIDCAGHCTQIDVICTPQLVSTADTATIPNGGAVRVSQERGMSQKVMSSGAAMWPGGSCAARAWACGAGQRDKWVDRMPMTMRTWS